MNPKGENLVPKHVFVYFLTMFAVVHAIEVFSSRVMYLELYTIIES